MFFSSPTASHSDPVAAAGLEESVAGALDPGELEVGEGVSLALAAAADDAIEAACEAAD
jgi:hypothetical protein